MMALTRHAMKRPFALARTMWGSASTRTATRFMASSSGTSVRYGGCELEVIPDQMELKEYLAGKIAAVKDGMDAMYVCDLGDVIRKCVRWSRELPRVTPYYAVKCHPDDTVMKLLAALGCGFDVASKAEIDQALSAGASTDRIIYAHPCKQLSYMRHAASRGVHLTTFDNEAELIKTKETTPQAQLVIRIRVDDPTAYFSLGKKFGCNPSAAEGLLRKAKEMNLNVVGVSFHVGGGCNDASTYGRAIGAASDVFRQAESLGMSLRLLDIGGGFPGTQYEKTTFEQLSAVIRDALERCFPKDRNVTIIAEPGTYVASSAFTMCSTIVGKGPAQEGEDEGIEFIYYLADGTYQTTRWLNPIWTWPYAVQDHSGQALHGSRIWGPTCDTMDMVLKRATLPELAVGEWIYFPNMGAYSLACASSFNGMEIPRVFYVIHRRFWKHLQRVEARAAVSSFYENELLASCRKELREEFPQ